MPRKIKPKPRNNGTMTEAAFWGWVRSSLRRRFVYWKPRSAALQANRIPSKRGGRTKWEYMCQSCNKFFLQKEVEVDHLIECGSLRSAEDLPGFVERLFCEKDGLQVLCKDCHKKKTQSLK